MIPKHVEGKIKTRAGELYKKYNNPTRNDRYNQIYQSGAKYGYSVAMEEMKPILDAARELVNWPSMTQEYQSREVTDSVKKLSHLLKQYDNEQAK